MVGLLAAAFRPAGAARRVSRARRRHAARPSAWREPHDRARSRRGSPGRPRPGPPGTPRIAPPIRPASVQTGLGRAAATDEALRSFTDAALERTALADGLHAEESRRARVLADARQRRARGDRTRSGRGRSELVLAAYAIVWVLFAIPYLLAIDATVRPDRPARRPDDLAAHRAPGLSLAGHRAWHPDPTRARRALVILLVVPVVLLLGIGGLVPAVRPQYGGRLMLALGRTSRFGWS